MATWRGRGLGALLAAMVMCGTGEGGWHYHPCWQPVETVAAMAPANRLCYVWEPYLWDDFPEIFPLLTCLMSYDYTVVEFQDRNPGAPVGGCTRDNFYLMGHDNLASIVVWYTHGGFYGGFSRMNVVSNAPRSWMTEGTSPKTALEWEPARVYTDCRYFLRHWWPLGDGTLEGKWDGSPKKAKDFFNRGIIFAASCFSGYESKTNKSLLDHYFTHYRTAFGYKGIGRAAPSDMQAIFRRMIGELDGGQNRKAGDAYEAGGHSTSLVPFGNPNTTLCPAIRLRDKNDATSFDVVWKGPDAPRKGDGYAWLDTNAKQDCEITQMLTWSANGVDIILEKTGSKTEVVKVGGDEGCCVACPEPWLVAGSLA